MINFNTFSINFSRDRSSVCSLVYIHASLREVSLVKLIYTGPQSAHPSKKMQPTSNPYESTWLFNYNHTSTAKDVMIAEENQQCNLKGKQTHTHTHTIKNKEKRKKGKTRGFKFSSIITIFQELIIYIKVKCMTNNIIHLREKCIIVSLNYT